MWMVKDIDDAALGRLTWYGDDDPGQWIANVEIASGHAIEVIVEFREGDDDQAAVLAQARQWLARVGQREPEYREWTAGELVNGRWNMDEPMTAADIAKLLSLLSVVCFPEGTAELFWDDDDRLFYGHSIGTLLGTDGGCAGIDKWTM
jgi:hypothetical protein